MPTRRRIARSKLSKVRYLARIDITLTRLLLSVAALAERDETLHKFKKLKVAYEKKKEADAALPKIPKPEVIGNLCKAIGLNPKNTGQKNEFNDIKVSTVHRALARR